MATPSVQERSLWQRFLHGDPEWVTRPAGYGTKAAIGLFFATSLAAIILLSSNPAPKPIYGRAFVNSMDCKPAVTEKAPASYTILSDQYQSLAAQNPTARYDSRAGTMLLTAGAGDVFRAETFNTTRGPVQTWKSIGPSAEMTGTQKAPQQGCVLTEQDVWYKIE